MSGTLRRGAAVLTVAATALVALPAAASAASLGPAILPNQFFTGSVTGIAAAGGAATSSIIGVDCAGAASTGNPLPGQTIEVKLAPPTVAETGYTGSAADSIVADLIWSYAEPPIIVQLQIGTFTAYSTPLPIPTDIDVPCSGTGEVSFNPAPTSSSAVSAVVPVTFVSVGA